MYNDLISAGQYDVATASLFIWLNKHCFNGLYRVNRKGIFNVPWNKAERVRSADPKNIREVSDFLAHVDIRCGDFAEAVKDAQSGDFIFFDSPYAPLAGGSFENYTKDCFPEAEHMRLASLFHELTNRGCYCMATNHNTKLIDKLYSKYHIEEIPVRRSINSDPGNRTGVEIIITNYER